MKNNKAKNTNLWPIAAVLIVLAVIIGGIYLIKTGVIPLTGYTTIIPDVGDKDYEPPEEDDCTDFDISVEYRKYIGHDNVNAFRTACIDGVNGTWREFGDEMACYWNPLNGATDCNSNAARVMGDFCEDDLLATWVCDNTIAYAGCLCKKNTPTPWNEQQEEGEYGYECGWYNVGQTGMVECRGDCDDPDERCAILPFTDICDCFTEEEIADGGKPKLTVFVTDNTWNGAMGWITGADEKCSVSASFAGLGPGFEAIISNTTLHARDKIADGIYVRLDGAHVAESKADLFDGNIAVPIDINENFGPETGYVWTGSFGSGLTTGNNCHEWGWVAELGTRGEIGPVNSEWLIESRHNECTDGNHLYCVEIPQD